MNFLASIESRVNAIISGTIGSCMSTPAQQDNEDTVMVDVQDLRTTYPVSQTNIAYIQQPTNDLITPCENQDLTNAPVNTVIYVRVSTKPQELEAQKHTCVEYCQRRNLNIVEIVEEYTSAYNTKSFIHNDTLIQSTQPKLYKLLSNYKDISLVVFSIDRLSRNTDNCNIFINLLETNNIILRCVKETVNLSCAIGKHNFRKTVSLAQYESERIGERVRNNIKYKRDNGYHIGRAPFGYMVSKDTKKLVINLLEQKVVKFMIESLTVKDIRPMHMTDKLFALLISLDMNDESNFVPLEAVVEINGEEYTNGTNGYLHVTYGMLKDILNDYNILNRGKRWTNHAIKNAILKYKTLTSSATLLNQINNLRI